MVRVSRSDQSICVIAAYPFAGIAIFFAQTWRLIRTVSRGVRVFSGGNLPNSGDEMKFSATMKMNDEGEPFEKAVLYRHVRGQRSEAAGPAPCGLLPLVPSSCEQPLHEVFAGNGTT